MDLAFKSHDAKYLRSADQSTSYGVLIALVRRGGGRSKLSERAGDRGGTCGKSQNMKSLERPVRLAGGGASNCRWLCFKWWVPIVVLKRFGVGGMSAVFCMHGDARIGLGWKSVCGEHVRYRTWSLCRSSYHATGMLSRAQACVCMRRGDDTLFRNEGDACQFSLQLERLFDWEEPLKRRGRALLFARADRENAQLWLIAWSTGGRGGVAAVSKSFDRAPRFEFLRQAHHPARA